MQCRLVTHGKILRGLIFFFLFLLLAVAAWCSWLIFEDRRAADYVAEMERAFPDCVVLPADPDAISDALDAFEVAYEANRDDVAALYPLATNTLARVAASYYTRPLDERYSKGFISLFRFFSEAAHNGLQTGDYQRFMRAFEQLRFACDHFIPPVSNLDLMFKNMWLTYFAETQAQIGAFPETTLAELEDALRRLPSDAFLCERIIAAWVGEYHHVLSPRLATTIETDTFFAELRKERPSSRFIPRFILFSNSRTKAQFLRYVESLPKRLNVPSANNQEKFESTLYRLNGNFVGHRIASLSIPVDTGMNPHDARFRDRINFYRLGLACQVFYRRLQRAPASLDELVSEGILSELPAFYSSSREPFHLSEYRGEPFLRGAVGSWPLAFRFTRSDAGLLIEDFHDWMKAEVEAEKEDSNVP